MRLRNLGVVIALLSTLLQGHSAAAQMITQVAAGKEFALWLPSDHKANAPLIIISHGLNGCYTKISLLGDMFAKNGYAVVAPSHTDNTCDDKEEVPLEADLSAPKTLKNSAYQGRANDVRTVIEEMKKDKILAKSIDFSRIGLVGISMGGYTMIGIASSRWGWTIPGVKAVLAMSPYCMPFSKQHTMSKLRLPISFKMDHVILRLRNM